MKRVLGLVLLSGSLLSRPVPAQNYSIDWYKVAGGGATSIRGGYELSGTIGQSEATANSALAGGNYSVTGGYWSLYAMQTTGYPTLFIRMSGPATALVYWANYGNYQLQTNSDLTSTNWVNYNGNILLNNGTNNVAFSPPAGKLFFRLK